MLHLMKMTCNDSFDLFYGLYKFNKHRYGIWDEDIMKHACLLPVGQGNCIFCYLTTILIFSVQNSWNDCKVPCQGWRKTLPWRWCHTLSTPLPAPFPIPSDKPMPFIYFCAFLRTTPHHTSIRSNLAPNLNLNPRRRRTWQRRH